MSVKIRVSYTDDEELAGVIRLLSPCGEVPGRWQCRQEGAYRNAYIYLHPFDRTNELARNAHPPKRNEAKRCAGGVHPAP